LKCASVVLLACIAPASWGGDFSLRQTIRETPILWKPSFDSAGTAGRRFDNLLHLRQTMQWFPAPFFRADLELKTRFLAGESVRMMKDLVDTYVFVQPYFRLTRTFVNCRHAVLVSTVDRAWVDGTFGSLDVVVGRQRIAWGTNWVWNPTDLFNPASPLDFDNEKKPGTDAVRAEWYWGPNSVLDAAVAPQRKADSTVAAVRLKTNLWRYDWSVTAGRRGPVTVAGFAWAGQVHGGGFRGEMLYSIPRDKAGDEELSDGMGGDDDAYCTAAVSGDYTFRSSLYLHGEILYNERGTTGPAGGYRLLRAYAEAELSPARLSLFGEIARDLSPLVRVDLAGIFNPNDHSWYAGPSFTWSVLTNLDLTLTGLVFGGQQGTEFGDNGQLLMARLSLSL
jgi:hypothetical protein